MKLNRICNFSFEFGRENADFGGNFENGRENDPTALRRDLSINDDGGDHLELQRILILLHLLTMTLFEKKSRCC